MDDGLKILLGLGVIGTIAYLLSSDETAVEDPEVKHVRDLLNEPPVVFTLPRPPPVDPTQIVDRPGREGIALTPVPRPNVFQAISDEIDRINRQGEFR